MEWTQVATTQTQDVVVTTEALPDHESIYGHREVYFPHSSRRRVLGADPPEYVVYYWKDCKRARCTERVHVYMVEGTVYYLDNTPVMTEGRAQLPFCSWKCAGLFCAKQARDTEG